MKIYVKKPHGRQISYSIYRREVLPNGKTKNITIESPELHSLNQNLDKLPADIILKNVLAIKTQLEKKLGIEKGVVVHNADNERIFSKYWDKKYKHRDLIDKDSARYKFERALKALGNVSLLTGTEDQINAAILSQDFNRNKKRELFAKVQILLKFLGRDLELLVPREQPQSVSYISESDFIKSLDRVSEPHFKYLFYTLFYTGLRIGEAFALSEFKLRPAKGIIVVDSQLDDEGILRLPKWEKVRDAFVTKDVFSNVKEWIKIKDSFPCSRLVANYWFKIYFGQKYTIHDLRHSYAIRLLSKGVPLSLVAQSLGNSVKVCEKYYTGFQLVDESIELMRKIMGD